MISAPDPRPPRSIPVATDRPQRLIAEGVIVCPECRGRLDPSGADQLRCASCTRSFPIVRGIPVLLHAGSAFTAEQLAASDKTYFAGAVAENQLKRRIRKGLPGLAGEYTRDEVDGLVRAELAKLGRRPRGLVIGSGERGLQLEARLPEVDWITTDVDLAYGPDLIADVLSLPIADRSVDLVVAEQVLEHVIDIVQGARELERVCRPGALVVAKVPFCFPWHGVPIDFFRCSPAGLRALFPSTEVVYLGQCMGPWGTLAYQLDSRLINLTSVRAIRWGSAFASRFLFGWLKWLDRLPPHRKRDLTTTLGVTYVGRMTEVRRSARQILSELQEEFGRGMM